MSDYRYVCTCCGGTFIDPDPHATWDEALDTFQPAELHGAAVLCEDCWRDLRARNPQLDARYMPTDAFERFVRMRRELRIEVLHELLTFTEHGVDLTSEAIRELIVECERATEQVQWP